MTTPNRKSPKQIAELVAARYTDVRDQEDALYGLFREDYPTWTDELLTRWIHRALGYCQGVTARV